ncbi:hypothetical protein J6590_103252 [Homalodisca vitripennis]|nr:hypothetical protein J6590_103252 [Homalodisca vitripennis]
MAARPRPLPPSPPPSNTPRPLLDPLRRPPSQWESSKPPTLRERWRTSDGGRAMADERWRTVSWRMNKNLCLRRPVSEPGPLRMRDCRADHWTTETSCAWRRDMAVRAARGARRSTGFFHISCSFLALRLQCCYLVETAYNMLVAASEDVKKNVRVRLRCCYLVETAYNILVATSEDAKSIPSRPGFEPWSRGT